ncbi:MAM domain-containing glycosylphosphatidylinositol anchor protein 1-like [Crassostrea virginica]
MGSYYKFLESSAPYSQGDVATMVSNMVFEAHTYCLSFDYHMYGSGMGTLKVQTQTGSENPVTLWMMSGNQGTKWHRLYRLAIPLDQNTKLLIKAIRGSSYLSDIAIDYVILSPYGCP